MYGLECNDGVEHRLKNVQQRDRSQSCYAEKMFSISVAPSASEREHVSKIECSLVVAGATRMRTDNNTSHGSLQSNSRCRTIRSNLVTFRMFSVLSSAIVKTTSVFSYASTGITLCLGSLHSRFSNYFPMTTGWKNLYERRS